MRIAVLYIAIGNYDFFFKGFYKSCERYFLPESDKEYFVFTDSKKRIFLSSDKIHRIQQQDMGWPDNTMQRFRLFESIGDELADFDYIFFFNANIIFAKTVTEAVLPQHGLIVVRHPGFYKECNPNNLTYERSSESQAYIPYGQGEIYVCGGVNGGTSDAYLAMVHELRQRTDKDTANGVVARFHDESQLNRYILDISKDDYTVWDCGYAYPDIFYLPGIEMKAKLRTKQLYIPVLGLKGTNKLSQRLKMYLYTIYRLLTSTIKRSFDKLRNK